jgi:hypothetical protein
MRDYDDAKVWFDVEDPETTTTYEQAYTLTEAMVTLEGDRVEVRATTTYVPTDSAPNPAAVTEKKEAAVMATTTIEETELAQLREAASRATTAEAELKKERTERASEASQARKDKAASIVREAFGDDAPAFITESAQLMAGAEDFDAAKLADSVTEAAAKFQSQAGAGRPSGIGAQPVTETRTFTDDDTINALEGGK